ncbi:hypothetical protein [Botrimarina sp.]|uniref:hypothetical protein n=1 Tax=Botrimarina sp. TaxID=2795802 RepID=UPI0032F058CB
MSVSTAPTAVAPGPTASPLVKRSAAAAPKSSWAFADQAIVSLANFAAVVLVGRFGGQEQLGFFTLGVSLYLFALGLGRAVVWTTYTQRHAGLGPDQRRLAAGSATVHLIGFAAATCLAILACAGAASAAGLGAYAAALAGVGPFAAAMLLREHVRRLGLARLQLREVLAFDTLVAVAQLAALGWLAWSGRMSAPAAYGAMAAASLLAVPWMAARRTGWGVDWRRVAPDWRASWATSKWLTGGGLAVLLGKQGYVWLLPAVASVAELGTFGAAQVIVQVTNPILLGGQNYLGPASAKVLAEGGVGALWRFTIRVSLAMAAAIAAYLVGVGLLGLPVVQGVFGETANQVSTLLLVSIAAGALSEAMLIPIEFASINLGRARLMAMTAVVRLAINATVGFALVAAYGAVAIGVGLLAGSLVALAWQWRSFAREARHA